ncbi:CDP-glycerol glycerophosphotransferase family protein [Brevibacterium aurantiacum]|uniref:CDP-glycerol glycerophosphotransferase family protein n=1 Tax=Brevibacterium aurantiacum TaxID=273384 RepID=UPI001865DDC9|nr:CDP-glycerol glycerophosphotransferase family protein [Brevibacterium aurantiacum]
MASGNSLLHGALADAKLVDEAETDAFWSKPLGKNAKTKAVRHQYIRDSANFPVNKTVIFYETMSGARMGDNPYGIFEHLRSHPEYGDFLHVWSVDSRAAIPEQYRNTPDVVFARRNTRSYTYFLATAGFVVCNANLPGFFTRRPEQRYLNTWHGIPYKALGRSTPTAKFGSPAGNATFTKATHILTPCEFTTQKIISAYSMSGVSNATIAELGYPRVDRTIAPKTGIREELRETLGLQPAQAPNDHKPVVLYAPTWRSENDKDVVDSDQLMADLKTMAGLDVQLMYRGHHRMDRLIRDASVGDEMSDVIIPPHEISSNDLLTVVDILITDFSSIFFDFLPTGLPIVHYLYDLDEYAKTRGINLETNELPGAVALTRNELAEAVATAASVLETCTSYEDAIGNPVQGDNYRAAQERFCPSEDGHSSKRAADFLIKDEANGRPTRKTRDDRPTAAFWAGTLQAGPRTDSFLKSLLKSASSPAEQTVLIVDRQAPIDKTVLRKIKKFGDELSTFSYDTEPTQILPEEMDSYNEFASGYYLDFSKTQLRIENNDSVKELFRREYRRRLDDAQFDRVFLAADLPIDELAMASMAGQHTTTTADSWTPPSNVKVSLPTASSTADRLADCLLPEGTERRAVAARVYRKLRSVTRRQR